MVRLCVSKFPPTMEKSSLFVILRKKKLAQVGQIIDLSVDLFRRRLLYKTPFRKCRVQYAYVENQCRPIKLLGLRFLSEQILPSSAQVHNLPNSKF